MERSDLPSGFTETRKEGREGKQEITYKVTYTDGVETRREKVSEKIAVEPVDKVEVKGTKEDAAVASDLKVATSESSSSSGLMTILGVLIVVLIGFSAFKSQRRK